MQIPLPLVAELALLTTALYDPASHSPVDIAQTALVLVADARLTVTSFVGLTILVTEHSGCEPDRVLLRLTLLNQPTAPGAIGSSLRLPGSGHSSTADQPRIRLILYAAAPGAFVDLAADIAFLTGREFDPGDLDQHLGLAAEPDVTGVIEAIIGEALGVLLARGRTHDEARAELDGLAVDAGTDRLTEATGILAALTRDPLDRSAGATPTSPPGVSDPDNG